MTSIGTELSTYVQILQKGNGAAGGRVGAGWWMWVCAGSGSWARSSSSSWRCRGRWRVCVWSSYLAVVVAAAVKVVVVAVWSVAGLSVGVSVVAVVVMLVVADVVTVVAAVAVVVAVVAVVVMVVYLAVGAVKKKQYIIYMGEKQVLTRGALLLIKRLPTT